MSIFEAIPFRHEKDEMPPSLTEQSSSAEWMRTMQDLTAQTLQADIAYEQAGTDVAFDTYIKKVGAIDEYLGDAAEVAATYVVTHGHRAYDKKGYATDGTQDVFAPLEIDVVSEAFTILETLNKRFPSDNARALLEALIAKYDGVTIEFSGIDSQLWSKKIETINEKYDTLFPKTVDSAISANV